MNISTAIIPKSSCFFGTKNPLKTLKIKCLEFNNVINLFFNKLSKEGYISWLIPVRKWVDKIYEIAQRNLELIRPTIDFFFKKLDYAFVRF